MKRFFMSLLIITLILLGCASVARYDKETYQYLTFAKADVVNLYEDKNLILETEWQSRAAAMLVEMDRMWEYERNKPKNKDTSRQFELLRETFITNMRVETWDSSVKDTNLFVIKEMFNVLIETENSKNRGSFF